MVRLVDVVLVDGWNRIVLRPDGQAPVLLRRVTGECWVLPLELGQHPVLRINDSIRLLLEGRVRTQLEAGSLMALFHRSSLVTWLVVVKVVRNVLLVGCKENVGRQRRVNRWVVSAYVVLLVGLDLAREVWCHRDLVLP